MDKNRNIKKWKVCMNYFEYLKTLLVYPVLLKKINANELNKISKNIRT